MMRWLKAVRADNAKGEYYLTDAVALARSDGERVVAVEAPAEELVRHQLARRTRRRRGRGAVRLRAAAMDAGVTMIDPGSVFLCADTELAADVTIEPNVMFGPGVKVATGALIRVVQSPGRLRCRAVTASSARSPGCALARSSARPCMSAISSR